MMSSVTLTSHKYLTRAQTTQVTKVENDRY